MTSSELTGGTGFTYEDAVVAYFLGALLCGTTAAGLGGRIPQRIAQQQADFGEPLDDVVVDAASPDGESQMRLSLQVKRSLTISKSNGDFREVVLRSLETLKNPSFRSGLDRVGAVVDTVSDNSYRRFVAICEIARSSIEASVFFERFTSNGNASAKHSEIVDAVRSIASDAVTGAISDEQLFQLWRHLVIIQFDALHEGSTREAEVIASLQLALVSSEVCRGQELWRQLRQLAREGAGRNAVFSRSSLLRQLGSGFRFAGVPSLAGDMLALREATNLWLAQQSSTIGGQHVKRETLGERLSREISSHRLTIIKGLPGTGKTVLMRDLVARYASAGTTLLLTANRLEGTSWRAYASAIGLSGGPLAPLLTEIEATGSAILFVDGIDRIAPEHRSIVTDLIGQVLADDNLTHWRIVSTARDAGIEPLRNWIPPKLLADGGVGYVDVDNLDEVEAAALAEAIPALKPLLMGGDERVRSLARRPFFAAVLARGLSSSDYPANFAPTSEVDLIETWWQRGGYDSVDGQTLARQRALIEMAQRSAPDLGRNLRIGQLSPAAQTTFAELERDGLVQQVRRGHTAQFSHDIFFEWSFYHLLLDSGHDWTQALSDAGEPPALARVVELLSQATYSDASEWKDGLGFLERAELRPQWLRAWLIAPVFSSGFAQNIAGFRSIMVADECRLLARLLVWIQAEKTSPNPLVMSGQLGASDMQAAARIRLADALGWPSDFAAWRRLITWIVENIDDVPEDSLADAVRIFETWQMFAADVVNPVSELITELCATWLNAIEDEYRTPYWRRPSQGPSYEAINSGLRVPTALASELRSLLLRAARAYPALVSTYLTKLESVGRGSTSAFEDVMSYAPILSQTHPELLAAVARRTLLTDLPDDTKARWQSEAQARAKLRAEILAKPESERDRHDKLSIASPTLGNEFSYHDWDRLAIGADHQGYFPASPLREPFHSLLLNSHEVGLRLVRDMTNHATTAWVQLHQHIWDSGTPLVLTLSFPWGVQEFWGASRHYAWFRGHGGPQAVECGLMALESWALKELDGGRGADDLLKELLEGQKSIAVLGIAVHIALKAQKASATTLPLVTSQRLWRLDIHRQVEESQFQGASLIGFSSTQSESKHRDAVVQVGRVKSRRLELRSLVPRFVLGSDEALRNACCQALTKFPEALELEYQEESLDAEHVAHMKQTAELWAEWGRPENYAVAPVPGHDDLFELEVRSPRHSSPEVKQALEQYEQSSAEMKLWLWVSRCFEDSRWVDDFSVGEAAEYAKRIASSPSAKAADMESIVHGAIAGTAAAIYCFGGTTIEDLWVKATIEAYRDAQSNPEIFYGSIIPWHPKIFVARALAARISYGWAAAEDQQDLFRLVAHPLECVSLAAIQSVASCWDSDARLTWCGFNLALRLTRYVHRIGRQVQSEQSAIDAESTLRTQALSETMREYAIPTGFPVWELPRPSWERNQPGDNYQHYDDVDGWHRTDDFWKSQFAAKFLPFVPVAKVMASDAAPLYVDAMEGLLLWTLDTLDPEWRTERHLGRQRNRDGMYEWQMILGKLVAKVAVELPVPAAAERFLQPIADQSDDTSMSLLRPFVAFLTTAQVMDPPHISNSAIELLDLALDRTLQHRDLEPRRNDRGRLSGFDLPELVSSFCFVAVENAGGASRFANGQWGDLHAVFPLVDKLIRKAGWIPYVMGRFLTLCERAGTDYPIT